MPKLKTQKMSFTDTDLLLEHLHQIGQAVQSGLEVSRLGLSTELVVGWEGLLGELHTAIDQFQPNSMLGAEHDERVRFAQKTAVLRYVLKLCGGEEALVDSVLVGNEKNDVTDAALSCILAEKTDTNAGTFVEYRTFELGFHQGDLARASLARYKRYHRI
jgi:hypothetical protein